MWSKILLGFPVLTTVFIREKDKHSRWLKTSWHQLDRIKSHHLLNPKRRRQLLWIYYWTLGASLIAGEKTNANEQ